MTGHSRSSSSSSAPKGVHHRKNDVYSEQLPIPSIQRFFKRGLAEVITRGDDSEEESIESEEQPSSSPQQGNDSNKNIHHPDLDKNADKNKQYGRRSHKSRTVDDPITHRQASVHDVGRKEYDRAMEEAEDAQEYSASKREIGSRQSEEAWRKKHGDPNASKEASRNVLRLPFPPDKHLPSRLWSVHPLLLPLFIVWSGITALRIVHPLVSVASMAWLGWWGFRVIRAGLEDQRWDTERKRGQGASKGYYNHLSQERGSSDAMNGLMESAEWLNSIVESLWAVMNSDLFSSLGSTLEDVLQASTKGQSFIQSVKVEDLAQGSTPLRLTGFRVLGDNEAIELRKQSQRMMRKRQAEEKKVYMPQEKQDKIIDQDVSIPNDEDEENAEKERRSGGSNAERGGKVIDENTEGSFINLELSFIYRARPTTGAVASKSSNAHLLIKFWIGARKWYTVPVPVWVEIAGLVGTVRARIQLVPDPPFIKNVTFSLMGLPRTSVQVIPLKIKIQNLPFLADFIQSSIDAAMGEYCAPSSMTIDVGEALMGDNIKREVNAIGVVVIHIHRAFDLEKQDVRGSSDPYCTLALAKQGKIQYSTRVAVNDLSPRWEETCAILINPEAVRVKDRVAISLWDSDRFSADDMLGSASVDLQALVRRPGKMFRRLDTLVGLTSDMKKQGTISWSVGFFKRSSNKRRWTEDGDRQREEEEVKRVDESSDIDEEMQEEMVEKDMHVLDQDQPDLHLSEDEGQQTRNKEQASAFEPPSSLTPSGILSMQIHQIAQLEVVDTHNHLTARKSNGGTGGVHAGQKVDTVENQQDHPAAPSAYVTLVLNDETIFKSRVKALNNNPFFNAGSEKFVRNWRKALVMFVVWDSREREEDAILGVVPIKLSDIFKENSQVTQFFPIAGGVGKGRIRLSLLFRPIEGTDQHRKKFGWSIGTLRILSSLRATDFERNFSSHALRHVGIRARTQAGKAMISSQRSSLTKGAEKGDSKSVEWRIEKKEMPFKIPVRSRYATPFILEFRSLSALGIPKTTAVSIIWAQDIPDDEIVDLKLPIWKPQEGHDFHRLLQNYHNYEKEKEAESLGVERVGYLYCKLQFKNGVGKVHTKFGKANPDAKEVMQAWQCCTAMGLRNITGDFVTKEDKEAEVEGDDSGKESGVEGDSGGGLDDIDDDESDEEEVKQEREFKEHRSRKKSNEHDDDDDDDEDGEDDDKENDDVDGVLDKFRKWSEERKELHRQQRGIKQYKLARTATWLGKGVKHSGSRAVNKLKIQQRRTGQVESEL
ncbi:hypothetical protein CBS101457_000054 [Exobasidium rhododendri]|nr:hypothetical protein CBS101457_000054 [Exobasidium rhododendri]